MAPKIDGKRSGRILKSKRDIKTEKVNSNETKNEKSPKLKISQLPEQRNKSNQDDVKPDSGTDSLTRDREAEWKKWMAPSEEEDSDHSSNDVIVKQVVESLKDEEKHFTRAKVRV